MDDIFKQKLSRYIDAGFPIIYINTFEEDKVDRIIKESFSKREVYEWNETNGYIDFETKSPVVEDCTLEMMLDQLKIQDLLDRKLILLKDIVAYLDDPRIVSKLKGLARMINQGVDATIIIISSTVIIPKEIEKYTTILEMDYLGTDEIKNIIVEFGKQQGIVIDGRVIDEFARAFKGLTEYEIYNLLALS